MAITILQEPPKMNQVRQTIPFLVSSDIPATLGIDVIERSFKFLFEVKTLRADGTYRTYSKVSIPPRPDNLFGFFDASKIVENAISFNLATYTGTTAGPCDKSIVEFLVICTERYLDANGNYVSGTPEILGTYYAIESGVSEGLSDYVIDYTGSTKSPLHHHHLAGKNLVIRENEPLTLSWLFEPLKTGNLLNEIDADYGSFDGGTLTSWTGITRNTQTVSSAIGSFVQTPSLAQSGQCLRVTTNTTWFALNPNITSFTLWQLAGLVLEDNRTYKFDIFIRTNGAIGSFSSNRIWDVVAVGAKVASQSCSVMPVWSSSTGYQKVTLTFTTNAVSALTTITFGARSTAGTGLLTVFGNRQIHFDSMSLYFETTATPSASGGQILVDAGLPTAATYTLPGGYFTPVFPPNADERARFDTPIGAYTTLLGSTEQDTLTGLYKNSLGNIGSYYQLRLFSTTGSTLGLSEKIYQDPTPCKRFQNYRIKWLNEFGAWEYFTFNRVSTAKSSIERDRYKITRGRISDNQYREPDNDRGYKNLNIKETNTISLSSDWILEDAGMWLQSLFTSPEVYLLNPENFQKNPTSNEYDIQYPVYVENNEIVYKNNSVEGKLVNITIDLTLAVNFNEHTRNF
jgi:hypothetical protein